MKINREQSLLDFLEKERDKEKLLEQAKALHVTRENLHSIMTNEEVPKDVKDKINEMLADGGYECLAKM